MRVKCGGDQPILTLKFIPQLENRTLVASAAAAAAAASGQLDLPDPPDRLLVLVN